MEFKFKKHTKIVIDLEIGDKVLTNGWGYKLDGKIWTIEDMKFNLGRASAVLVKIDGYRDYIDSDWLIKAPTHNN